MTQSTKPLLAAALIVLAVLSSLPAGAGDLSDPYEKTLFYSFPSVLERPMEEDTELQIVPISRLQAGLSQDEVKDALPPEKLSALVSYVNLVAERRKSHRKACGISPADLGRYTHPTDPKSPDAADIRPAIAAGRIVLLGEVEFIAPAWDFHYETVVSVVSFRIEEVFADASEQFATGELVTYVRQWGEATILGVDFCTHPPAHVPEETAPMIGDMLVLSGVDDLRNPNHLVVTHEGIYPVVEGLVIPPEGDTTPPGYSDRAATLEELRELFVEPESLFGEAVPPMLSAPGNPAGEGRGRDLDL